MPAAFRILLASFATAVAAGSFAPPASAEVLGSTIWDWNALPVTASKTGVVRNVVAAPTPTLRLLHVHVSTLNPVPAVPPHHHPTESMTVVLQGSVRYLSDGKVIDAKAGDFLFLSADAVHTPYNVTSEPVVYYAIEVSTEATPPKPGPPADSWAGPDKLRTGVFPAERGRARPTTFGSETVLVSSPTVTLIRLECAIVTVNSGADTGERREPQDGLLFLPGDGLELEIKGVSCRLSAGSMCFKASGDAYRVRNLGASPASFHLIRFTTGRTPR